MAVRKTVENVLQEIGLYALLGNFVGQKIEFDSLTHLSDTELGRLGVTTIGDRVRLREKVREVGQLQDNSVSRFGEGIRGIAVPSGSVERHLLFANRTGRNSRKRVKSEGKHRPWTVTFVCLTDKNCSKVPTAEVKEMLLKAGLGFKKIQFTSEDNLMEKVCSDDKDENNECVGFPQLKHSGGFELLRCQANSRELTAIDCPWTVKGLKKFIGSQTKIYIRPIQQNLSTEPIRAETVEADIREACRNCGLMIPVQCLRSHCLEGCQDMQTQHEVTANSPSETHLYTSQGNSDEELPEIASEIIHQQFAVHSVSSFK
ncbi:uncharacterized protein LOC127849229 [Dreissena polymorpha]|uniref:uncharacterized protein LOC127849229 n=1 Tax=Dreissena polymorpha TaxID=45954 RepID=UPI0022642AA6|nr:uncharacterized protein LOC127849229 [Dreissena polymorpha]